MDSTTNDKITSHQPPNSDLPFGMKRKRKSHAADGPTKRQRQGDDGRPPVAPLLEQYYHEVHSLRTYLVSRLPKSSKKRRRRLLNYGAQPVHDESILVDHGVAQLLDTILVGTAKHITTKEPEQLDQDISVFTQQVSESDVSITPNAGHLKQCEVGLHRSCLFV
jgi:telomerase reverse transcriptase